MTSIKKLAYVLDTIALQGESGISFSPLEIID